MNYKFVLNDRLLITLINGENFEGDYVRGNDKRIEIKNITSYETGNKIDTTLTFYKREVTKVRIINPKQNKPEKNTSKTSNSSNVLMDREEYERLKDVARAFVYIKSNDNTYHNAVSEISNFESVGVLAIGAEKGRNGRISVIALSTWKQVYIFDLKNFRTRKFPNEIADILSSYYIKKVVHNGGPLKACLKFVYGIMLNNVFDTLVSQLMIAKTTSGKTPESLKNINECLTEYFNFPSSLLTTSLEALKESWEDRPLETDKIEKLSRLVTYLISIKDHQMELMLKNYDKAVDDFHKLYTDCSAYDAEKILTNEKCTEEIDKVIPFHLLSFKEK